MDLSKVSLSLLIPIYLISIVALVNNVFIHNYELEHGLNVWVNEQRVAVPIILVIFPLIGFIFSSVHIIQKIKKFKKINLLFFKQNKLAILSFILALITIKLIFNQGMSYCTTYYYTNTPQFNKLFMNEAGEFNPFYLLWFCFDTQYWLMGFN